jgi:hypothetical protein
MLLVFLLLTIGGLVRKMNLEPIWMASPQIVMIGQVTAVLMAGMKATEAALLLPGWMSVLGWHVTNS